MKESTVNRKINFGSGPAALPEDVLRQASEAVVDYNSSGLSILEIPHRGELFTDIIEESKQLVKELCGLSDDYEVLWLHGGGRLQFCMVPMNFLGAQDTAGYVDSGHWSAEAISYAQYYGGVRVLASSRNNNYNSLPILPADVSADLTYLHLTTNNTIYGTQWPGLPKSSVPLIADMSSDIFSRKRDYSACAMFYAVAQKNIGAAGTTLVVIHKDQLARVKRELPPMLDYRVHVEKKSVLNTSPVFAIYTALLMLRWTKARTIETLEQESIRKSAILYEALEKSKVFSPVVTRVEDRSRMNVCFKANNAEIEKGFSDFCTRNGIAGLEGHRTVGGFRVSLYNAITVTQVEQLVCVMQEYEAIQHSKLNNSKSS
jgi:phosphoserine aminotransferase